MKNKTKNLQQLCVLYDMGHIYSGALLHTKKLQIENQKSE